MEHFWEPFGQLFRFFGYFSAFKKLLKNQRAPKPALGGKAVSRRTPTPHFLVHGEGKGRGKPFPLRSRDKQRKRAGVGTSSIPPVAQGLVGFISQNTIVSSYALVYMCNHHDDFLYLHQCFAVKSNTDMIVCKYQYMNMLP